MLVKQHAEARNGTDFAEDPVVRTMQTNASHSATRRDGARDARSSQRPGEHYELLGELATGGMATVYLGRLRRAMGWSRLVAIKCMHPQYAKDPSFASMFVDEARLTARLRHPNIVPTLDIVADGGHLLIVMEYVEGESLAGVLRLVREAGDRVPVPVACAIIHDLLLGLHEAHEAHDDDGSPLAIIHRDVSPQNVMVGLDGLTRVLDFGVAKARSRVHHSNEGEIKGKIPYMPPEQLFGEGVDRRVDVYAAGVLLWEALVGQRLFEGSSEEVLVRRIDAGDAAAPGTRVSGIAPELDALVMRALCKDPDGRFSTALAMAEALSAIVALPPRTEISAWMKRFSRPRAVPAAAVGSSHDLRDLAESAGVSADAVVAVLERATVSSERHSRPSLVPVFSERAPAALTPARSRLTMAFGVFAFALAGVLVGRAMRAESAFAAPAHHAAAEAPPSHGVAAASVAMAAAPAATAATSGLDSAATLAPSNVDRVAPEPTGAARGAKATAHTARAADGAKAKAAGGSPGVATPPARAASPAAAATAAKIAPEALTAPARSAPDAKPASCRLPYVVDGEGHRHYKVECL